MQIRDEEIEHMIQIAAVSIVGEVFNSDGAVAFSAHHQVEMVRKEIRTMIDMLKVETDGERE